MFGIGRSRARKSALGALLLGALLALGLQTTAAGAHSKQRSPKRHSKHAVAPSAQGKPWRHGVVPQRGTRFSRGLRPRVTSANNLNYGGGINDGTNTVGVTTGAPQVYLVFWGTQWGRQSTNSAGYASFSCSGQPRGCKGDPRGMAPRLQGFFRGLGTGNEQWSGVMTQYCQSQDCSASKEHVGYPDGGALAGVWQDNSGAAPSQASGRQLAVEALKAASHFGHTTAGSNRNIQYLIVSPTGTHPDGFTSGGSFCAWHDYSGDSSLVGGAASYPGVSDWVAFTNMPYVTDVGTSCGADFVNSGSAGTLDGVTIVGGHEYAETLTDQYPYGGWSDSSAYENGDKCAWISTGQGASQNVTLTTGTFPVQSTWANDTANCQISDMIWRNTGNVNLTNPGDQTTTVTQQAKPVQMTAQEPDGTACTGCTFTATGLPSGIAMSSSGQISGTAGTRAGSSSVTVTATDAKGLQGRVSFTWTIKAAGVSSLTISPGNATVRAGGPYNFTATGADAYGNPADVSGTAWTVTYNGATGATTNLGSVSPASNSSTTTFTASSSTLGSGTIDATVSGITASASVTVVAKTSDPIVNGGFETGDLSGWTGSGAAYSVVSGGCHTGSDCAELGSAGATNGDSDIAQTFSVPAGASTLSFYYQVVCHDTVDWDWATAQLTDNATPGTWTTILPRTCSNTGSWSQVTTPVTPGHSYTLTLINHDDGFAADPTYTLYDDVTVQ